MEREIELKRKEKQNRKRKNKMKHNVIVKNYLDFVRFEKKIDE